MWFSLAGNGEISLSLMAKKPGPTLDLECAQTAIPLANLEGADPLPPYVRLIHDVLLGDRSLFTRPDGLAAVWDVAGPLLANPPRIVPYAQGSWRQAEARRLIAPGRWLLGQLSGPGRAGALAYWIFLNAKCKKDRGRFTRAPGQSLSSQNSKPDLVRLLHLS